MVECELELQKFKKKFGNYNTVRNATDNELSSLIYLLWAGYYEDTTSAVNTLISFAPIRFEGGINQYIKKIDEKNQEELVKKVRKKYGNFDIIKRSTDKEILQLILILQLCYQSDIWLAITILKRHAPIRGGEEDE